MKTTIYEGADLIEVRHTDLSPTDLRLEALRLAVIQAPGPRPATWTISEALERAAAFERYLSTGRTS